MIAENRVLGGERLFLAGLKMRTLDLASLEFQQILALCPLTLGGRQLLAFATQ